MRIKTTIIRLFLFIPTFFVFESHCINSTYNPNRMNKKSNLVLRQNQVDGREIYLSPVDLEYIESSNMLIIAQSKGKRIDFFDTRYKRIVNSVKLQFDPTGICLSSDKKWLYVTAGISEGMLYSIDIVNAKITSVTNIGHSPCSPVLISKNRIALCNRFSNQISFIDVKSQKLLKKIETSREPVSVDFCEKEKLLIVAHHLPDVASTSKVVSAKISFIDTEEIRIIKQLTLPDGSSSLKNIKITPDGRYAVVSHILARYNVHTSQLEQGWQNNNALTFIDINNRNIFQTILLDDLHHGYANPWALTFDDTGKLLIVTHEGTGSLSVINYPKLLEKLSKYPSNRGNYLNIENPINILSFISDCREVVYLKGEGPRSMVLNKNWLFIGQYFSDAIEIIEMKDEIITTDLVYFNNIKPDLVRQGEKLFYTSRLCFENWQSCASCHPDGRIDGFNWDLLNDGIGNPKNALSLLNSHQTPPSMSTGVRERAEIAVRSGIKYILFTEPMENDALAIDAFLKNMKAVPSPFLKKSKLTKSAKKGQKIFNKANCINCHSGPYFTDGKLYDVGTTGEFDIAINKDSNPIPQKAFVTPSLIELYRTAPYLHDGRYYTLEELFEEGTHGQIRKSTEKLENEEIRQLIEYLNSL